MKSIGSRRPLLLLASVAMLCAALSHADEYSDGWGPQVGSQLSILQAQDQSGTTRTLQDLTGRKGLLLFVNRSTDW